MGDYVFRKDQISKLSSRAMFSTTELSIWSFKYKRLPRTPGETFIRFLYKHEKPKQEAFIFFAKKQIVFPVNTKALIISNEKNPKRAKWKEKFQIKTISKRFLKEKSLH